MHKTSSHQKSRPTALRSALQITLLTSAIALAGCSSTDNSGGRSGLNNGLTPPPSTSASGETPLQTALGTTGSAADNVVDTGLGSVLGNAGKTLDGPLAPLYKTVDSTTQALGAQTGLGQPVDGVLKQTGGAVTGLAAQLSHSGLPSGLGEGTGALVAGVGNAIASAGGLLNKSADNTAPLTNTLAAATSGVSGLTDALTGTGGLLQPITGPLNNALGGPLKADGQPILQPALANTGSAVDQILPLGLQQPLGNAGATLDGVVSPVAGTITQVSQKVGDGLHVGAPINQLLTSLGGSLQQAGTGAGSTVPSLNGVISNLGATIANAGGIVHNTPNNTNPLGNTLNSATQAVVALTNGLKTTGLSQGAGGNLLGGGAGGGSPLSGLLGGLGGDATGGVLSPVTGLVGGATEHSGNGGLLGGLLGGLVSK